MAKTCIYSRSIILIVVWLLYFSTLCKWIIRNQLTPKKYSLIDLKHVLGHPDPFLRTNCQDDVSFSLDDTIYNNKVPWPNTIFLNGYNDLFSSIISLKFSVIWETQLMILRIISDWQSESDLGSKSNSCDIFANIPNIFFVTFNNRKMSIVEFQFLYDLLNFEVWDVILAPW